jgi:hypothetical protein
MFPAFFIVIFPQIMGFATPAQAFFDILRRPVLTI